MLVNIVLLTRLKLLISLFLVPMFSNHSMFHQEVFHLLDGLPRNSVNSDEFTDLLHLALDCYKLCLFQTLLLYQQYHFSSLEQ